MHVCEVGGEWERRHLAFRDELRKDPEAAAAYGELKRRLAAEHPRDIFTYIEGKADFIRSIEERALADSWPEVTSVSPRSGDIIRAWGTSGSFGPWRRLRPRDPHRQGARRADPGLGRLLPPLPRPARHLVQQLQDLLTPYLVAAETSFPNR